MAVDNAGDRFIPLPDSHHIAHPEAGGPIVTPFKEAGHGLEQAGHGLKEAAAGIFGTAERWGKAAWEGIKQAWNVSKEHLAAWFPIHHFAWTAGWIGLAATAGAAGILGGAEWFRRRRKKKKEALALSQAA